MKTPPQDWLYFGASVRGPAHIRAGSPNQDAWRGGRLQKGAVIAVCDGLGSRPHSRRGSQEACRAVLTAVRQWSAVPSAPIKSLLRLIHATWSLRIHPFGEGECATTCLFAVVDGDSRLQVAQLGDGLALVADGANLHTLSRTRNGFSNETTGLGIAKRLSEWETFEYDQCGADVAVLLTTDGIADDLVPDRLSGFLEHVRSTYCGLSPRDRWRRVCNDLKNWPTPHHSDDKTLALLWSDGSEAQKT